MELVQAFAAFFVAFAVAAAVAQILIAYSLQVIAEKNDLSDFTSFIAWIPVLNVYPFVKVAGFSFKKLVLGGIGACIASIVLVAAAGAAGVGEVGGIAVGAGFAILCIVYFARLAMATAERRGLNAWLGLLTFVPLANVLLYPYIAFHDGFRPPNKAGLVLGLLLSFGPLPGQIAMMNQVAEQAQEMASTDMGNGMTLGDAMGGLGAAVEIGSELSMLEGLDPSDPDQAAMMTDTLAAARQRLDENADVLGEAAHADLLGLIETQQERLSSAGAPGGPPAGDAAGMRMGQQMAAEIPAGPPLTAGSPRDGDNGFAVPANPQCPPGTTTRSSDGAEGRKQWCEKVGRDAGIKHGWMTEYHPNGVPAVAGEYRDGLRVGVWTRYYDSGTKRVQAEFTDGLQDGVLISWNPDGSKEYEKQFQQGAPASR